MSLKTGLSGMFLAVLLFVSLGCVMSSHAPSSTQETDIGNIKLLDGKTRSRLRISEHNYRRDEEGYLVVTVKWGNASQKDFDAQIRHVFWTSDGNKERGSFMWDLQTFPGESDAVHSWRSNTKKAVMYKIEVRKAH